jgi:hypothetical protein
VAAKPETEVGALRGYLCGGGIIEGTKSASRR